METAIQPIINGSVNPRLTPELFKELPFESKKSVIWNVIVSLEFAHSFPEVDPNIFEKFEGRSRWNFNDITEEKSDSLFIDVREAFKKHHFKMLQKTHNHHFELGKKIYKAQKELGFGGFLQLSKDKIQGYIFECGSWNDFNSSKVSAAIEKMHSLAPGMNYGVNNSNTGKIKHKWKTVSGCEYVTMEFDFINENELNEVKEFFNVHWKPKGLSIKADSIRFEEVSHGSGYFGIELVWWWD